MSEKLSFILRKSDSKDVRHTLEILRQIIRTGDTYVYDPSSTKEQMRTEWFSPEKHTYVAELDGRIVGTFYIKPNQPGLGSHIANAAYMIHPDHQGKGIGRKMAEYSISEAKELGFRAMQFNIVVETNTPAIALWKKMGFEVVGKVPEAFQHSEKGLVNALIMYRKL